MQILITGCAGFIGFHLTQKLIESKYNVIGIDNLNNYYDPKLKKSRLNILKKKEIKEILNFIKLIFLKKKN